MTATKIVKLRKTNRGIAGTYENIEHHAKDIEPFVRALEPLAPTWGFKTWRQGHNVHQFDTIDGRSYTLRPLWCRDAKGQDGRGYCGLALSHRLSRSKENVIVKVSSVKDIKTLSMLMHLLAKPQDGNVGGGLNDNE